jgi:hypothetical protein
MICTFKVYDGDHLQSNASAVYTIKMPCFTTDSKWNTPAIQSFIRWNNNNFIKDGNANGGKTFWSLSENDRNFAFQSSVAILKNFG